MEKDNTKTLLRELAKKQRQAQSVQSQVKPKYHDGYEFGLRRYGEVYLNNTMEGTASMPTEKKYTSFVKNTVDKAVNKMQLNIAPPQNNFIEIGLNDGADVDFSYFADINKRLNNWKNQSNFDSAAKEFFSDVLVGTGCMIAEVIDGKLKFINVPFNQYSFTENDFGDVDYIFRSYQMKGYEVNRLLRTKLVDDRDYKITEAVMRSWSDYSQWQTVLYSEEVQQPIEQKTDISTQKIISEDDTADIIAISDPKPFCKYIIARWNKQTNSQYGQGRILDCLTEIKQLNSCAKNIAVLSAYLIPNYVVRTNNGINPRTRIGAGSITYVQDNRTAEPAVQMLELSSDGLMGLLSYQQQLRQDVMDNLFIPDLMTNVSRTASELNDKINQLDTDLLAVFSSFQNELVYNFVNTVLHLAIEHKVINKIKEKNIYYNFDNQLSKVFKKNLPQLFTSLQMTSNIDPDLLVIKKKELSWYLMSDSVPVEMLNTVEEQMAEEQRLMEMAQQQQQQ